MSEYFRVLKRLRSEQPEMAISRIPAAVEPLPQPALRPVNGGAVHAAESVIPLSSASPDQSRAFGVLFENIRAAAPNATAARVFVFASASADPVYPVTRGLARYARHLGNRVIVADLTSHVQGRIQRASATDASAESRRETSVAIELGGQSQERVQEWIQSARDSADLVLVEARSLADSVDAALLARICDGLIIVARAERTMRQTLQLAAERARAAGCSTVGVVMHGSVDRVPPWLRRWTRPQSPASGRGE